MLIAITGKAQSGKSTIAEILEEQGWTVYSFADPIKKACKEMFNFDDSQLWGNRKHLKDFRWNITPREAMQIVGTELMRVEFPKRLKSFNEFIGGNIWIERFKQTQFCGNVVIPDCRFLNEAEAVRDMGGKIWKVDRGQDTNDGHISEMEMDGIKPDLIINNHGTIQELRTMIDKIMENE